MLNLHKKWIKDGGKSTVSVIFENFRGCPAKVLRNKMDRIYLDVVHGIRIYRGLRRVGKRYGGACVQQNLG